MSGREVVKLSEKQDELGLGAQQHTCVNPRCDKQFTRLIGPGRRKDFHDEDCRRAAERDLRRLQAQLAHYERQAEQLRARAAAYLRTTVADAERPSGPTDAQWQAARDAVLQVKGAVRFLDSHPGEFAADLVALFRAVEPVVGV